MKINRTELVSKLTEALVGTSKQEQLEQSDCFCFSDGAVTTFNDAVLARVTVPLKFDAVVKAHDFVAVLEKMPDDEVDVDLKGKEIVVSTRRRSAGLSIEGDIKLPFGDLYKEPKKWMVLPEECWKSMQSAALICGSDQTQFLTTVVHVNNQLVEACDNYRMIRFTDKTPLPEVLIPAEQLRALRNIAPTHAALQDGRLYLKTKAGTVIAVKISNENFHPDIDSLLQLDKPVKLTLPDALIDIVKRAEVMAGVEYGGKVLVNLSTDQVQITGRKDAGWYRETKTINYSGRPLKFFVSPEFICDVLSKTTEMKVDAKRLLVEVGTMKFVASIADEDTGE